MTHEAPPPTTNPSEPPPNATAVDPAPHNAAEDPAGAPYGEILRAAAAAPSFIERAKGFERTCARRFEHLLSRQFAVATPLPHLNEWGTFVGALAVNALIAAAAIVLGLLTVAIAALVQRCQGRGAGGVGSDGDVATACVTVRFPATALLCYIFLLAPSAAAAGVMIGSFIRNGTSLSDDDAGSDAIIAGTTAAIVGAAVMVLLLIASPIALSTVARRASPDRSVHVALPEGAKMSRRDDHLAGIDDSDIEDDDSEKVEGTDTSSALAQPRQLLCTVVRPRPPAIALGPIVGDVSTNASWGPAVTSSLLAALLFAGGLAGTAATSEVPLPITVPSAECAAIPLALGAAVALYAAAVAILRPFLGIGHNVSEALWAAIVAIIFIVWGAAIASEAGWATYESSSSTDADADALAEAFSPLLHLIVALCACRFPFTVARLLAVSPPSVAVVQWAIHPRAPNNDGRGGGPALALPSASPEAVGDCAVAGSVRDEERELVLADVNAAGNGAGRTAVLTVQEPFAINLSDDEDDSGTAVGVRTGATNASAASSSGQHRSHASSRSSVALPPLPRPHPDGHASVPSSLAQQLPPAAVLTRRSAAYAVSPSDSSSSGSDGLGSPAAQRRQTIQPLSTASSVSSVSTPRGPADTPSARAQTDGSSDDDSDGLRSLLGGSSDDEDSNDRAEDAGFDDYLYV